MFPVRSSTIVSTASALRPSVLSRFWRRAREWPPRARFESRNDELGRSIHNEANNWESQPLYKDVSNFHVLDPRSFSCRRSSLFPKSATTRYVRCLSKIVGDGLGLGRCYRTDVVGNRTRPNRQSGVAGGFTQGIPRSARVATGHRQHSAGDIACLVRCEEQNRSDLFV